MKNVIVCAATLVIAFAWISSPVLALPQFKKAWEERYLKDAPDSYKEEVKKAGCNLCHVKSEKSKEFRNAYGTILDKLIEGEAKDRIKEDKDKVMQEFAAALEKAECEKEGEQTYADMFKSHQVPSPEKPEKKD